MCSSFNFPHPTTTTDDLENLYNMYGVDRSVVLDLVGTHETLEIVREGYYRAYLSFFHSCGLTFPIPEPILEVLAELGLSLTQLLPNFLRHLVAFLVKAREEGLAFGLREFRQLILVKRNKQNPSTFLVSPRPGRHVIEDIPYRDEKWCEQFFVFKMDRASMGVEDYNFRLFSFDSVPSGSSSMSDEIHDLMRVLRRGRSNWSTFDRTRIQTAFASPAGTGRAPLVEESEDEAEHSQEVVATLSVQTQSSNRLTRQLVRRSSFQTSGFASRGRASRKSPLIWIPTTKMFQERLDLLSYGSSFAAQSDLISLAGRMRSAGCLLPSLASSVEREAYAKVAVVMEAFNEYVVTMEDHAVASRNGKEIESIGFEIKRLSKELEATKREGKKDAEKIESLTEDWRRVHLENETLTSQMVAQRARIAALEVERDRDIRRASHIARRDTATKYREVLESLNDRWASKKKEVSAEIWIQEVTANIDLLNELKDGGLTVDAELARLKGMEGDCEDLVALTAVPDWSISQLDLPRVSDDSVDQVRGSSVPDDSVSS
ncbi:hypothetical protein F2Q69_00013781 [Brassica cretica]|uniref:Uncharacterized protein n=1 Tax=Brassica cretica TaxID=69181 RepID=A0A8S9QWL4_BRACR|nr:hypothetical protein F2Q69_00013781 [Brassica cretica]